MSPVNFDIDTFDEAIHEAPKVGFGPRSAFGKLTIADIQIMAWERKKGEAPKPIPRPFTGKDKPDVGKGEYLQVTFEVDIQELSTQAQENGWEWKRRVDVRQNSADGKAKTDWEVYVLPSLIEVIGKDWMKKLQKGVYVEVLEPDTVVLDKQGNKKGWTDNEGQWRTNTTLQVARMFKSKSDCEAARNEKYTARESFSENGDEEKTVSIPKKVIADVVGILNVYDGDTENEDFLELLQSEPYNQYPLTALIGAAQKAISK